MCDHVAGVTVIVDVGYRDAPTSKKVLIADLVAC